MPKGVGKAREAVYRFISRVTICSELREAFTGPNFEKNFPEYFARQAITPDDQEKLRKLMNEARVTESMAVINEALHTSALKPFRYAYTSYTEKPYRFWCALGLGLLIIASAAAVLYQAQGGEWPLLLSVSGGVSLAAGLVVVWDAFSYEAL